MKKLITILLLAISGLASAQQYQLNYADIRIGNLNSKTAFRGNNILMPYIPLGLSTDSVLTIAGGQIKKVPRSQFSGGGSSYTFNNGLTESSGVVGLGGDANWNYTQSIVLGNPFSLQQKASLQLYNDTPFGNSFALQAGAGIVGGAVGGDNNSVRLIAQNNTGVYIDNTGMVFRDYLLNRGPVAFGNYEANYVPLSYTSKKYVDSLVSASGGGSVIYANQGLTKDADTIKLGGTYSGQKLFFSNLGNNNFSFGNGSGNSFFNVAMASPDLNKQASLTSGANNIRGVYSIGVSLSGIASLLSLTTDNGIYISDEILHKGLGDFANYDGNKTANSYVTKRMLDSVASGSGSAPDTTIYRTVSNSFSKAQTNTQISNAIAAYTPPSQVDNDLSASTTRAPSKSAVNTALALKADKTTTITAGNGLTGGGDLSANRTLSVDTTIIRTVANSRSLAQTQTALNAKQNTLVSGTNIKTINGNTILGSGDLVVGGSSYTSGYGIGIASNVISADTTSTNGLVSKSRLTASLQNFNVTARFKGVGTVGDPFDLNTVAVPFGGTGATTLTGIVKGNGTSAFTAAVAGDFPTLNQNTTGSAATLTTPRTINGVSFNGSANINITSPTLTTTRTIWGQNFNGSANVTGALSGVTTITATDNFRITTTLPQIRYEKTGVLNWYAGVLSGNDFIINNDANAGDELTVKATGNVLIGTSTDDGVNKQQINGTVSATTPTAKANNTQLATTAFVGKQFTATASGTGSATTITFAHGVSGVTSSNSVVVTANNAAAGGIIYANMDATNVNVVYSVAPASGSSNLLYSVSIK